MTTQQYPLWEELPEIELYLDQVLLYVNQVTQSTLGPNDKGLTASMVNNYKTLEILRTDAESQKSYYNDFVACMNGQFPQEAPQVILSACQTLQCYRATHQLLNDLEGGNNV